MYDDLLSYRFIDLLSYIYACHMIKRFNVWHEITCPILTYVESHFYHFSKISLN